MHPDNKLVDFESLQGFKVAADESDPRGWIVVSCDGDQVGVVRTMLVDTVLLKARYFVTELTSPSRRVLLPVALARLDDRAKRVIFDVSPLTAFAKLPDYVGTEPTQAEDDATHIILAGAARPQPAPESSQDRRRQSSRRTPDQ